MTGSKALYSKFTYRDALVLFIIIFSAATLSITENDTFLLVLAIVLVLYAVVEGYIYETSFFYLMLCYWGLIALITLFTSSFDFRPTVGYFLRITTVYILLRIIGPSFWILVEKWVYRLTLLSLPLFAVQLVAYDFLQAVARIFNFEHGVRLMGGAIDWLFFHVDGWAPTRNAGFMWEPGSFGMVITFGMILNYYFSNNKYFFSNRNLVYILAIISTQSTTAYLNVFVLFHFVLLNGKRNKNHLFWLILPAIYIGAVAAFLSLDFLAPKLAQYVDGTFQFEQLVGSTTTFEGEGMSAYITVGRFSMLVVDLKDLLQSPVFGLGFSYDLRTDALFQKFSRVNGLSDYIATFGLVGLCFMIWALRKMFRLLEIQSQTFTKYKILCVIVIFAGFFSNPVVNNFFTLSWLLFGLANFDLVSRFTAKQVTINEHHETSLVSPVSSSRR